MAMIVFFNHLLLGAYSIEWAKGCLQHQITPILFQVITFNDPYEFFNYMPSLFFPLPKISNLDAFKDPFVKFGLWLNAP
jgi:hypothetical protein